MSSLGETLEHAKGFSSLSDRALSEDSAHVTLPRLMETRQPMFRLVVLAGRDRNQRIEIDGFILSICVEPSTRMQSAALRWRSRPVPGLEGCRHARTRPILHAEPRPAGRPHPPMKRPVPTPQRPKAQHRRTADPPRTLTAPPSCQPDPASAPRISRNRLIRTSVNTVVTWSAKSPTVAIAPATLCRRPAMKSRNDAPATSIYRPSR